MVIINKIKCPPDTGHNVHDPAAKLCIFEETELCIVLSIIELSLKSHD